MSKKGDFLLKLATLHEDNEMIEKLIEFGADINRRDNFGNTPLLLACAKGLLVAAELLIKKGAILEIENSVKKNALILATESGNIKLFNFLAEKYIIHEKDFLAKKFGQGFDFPTIQNQSIIPQIYAKVMENCKMNESKDCVNDSKSLPNREAKADELLFLDLLAHKNYSSIKKAFFQGKKLTNLLLREKKAAFLMSFMVKTRLSHELTKRTQKTAESLMFLYFPVDD